MNSIAWAKKHKLRLVMSIVDGVRPSSGDSNDDPAAVFAAGIPGAGKTEFLDRLLVDTVDIVRIDMDEIVKLFPGYTPENYYRYRGAAAIIVDEAVIYCRKHRLDFVLDGTFGSVRAVENIRRALKRHQVTIFYVWKEPELAWQHTKDRQLVTKRGVDKAGFIEACLHVPENIKTVRQKFGKSIYIAAIRKNPHNDDFQMSQNESVIDKLLEVDYTGEDLERTLK